MNIDILSTSTKVQKQKELLQAEKLPKYLSTDS